MNYFSNLYLALYGDKVSSSSKCNKGITCQNVYGRAFDFRHDEFVKFMPRGLVVRCISCLRRAELPIGQEEFD